MRIGSELPFDDGWHFVEGDLYDIHRRVKEYDPLAALVRNPESGQLGLARFNPSTPIVPGGAFILSTTCLDPLTRQPLTGEPDARVVTFQRIADGHRITNHTTWVRRRRDAMAAERAAQKRERLEWSDAHASEFVWRHSRIDKGRRPFASIPKEIH